MPSPLWLLLLYVEFLIFISAGTQGGDGIAVITTGEALVLDCFLTNPDGDQDHDVTWFLDDVQVSTAVRLEMKKLNHTHHGSNVTCYNGTVLVTTRTIHFHHKMVFEVGGTLKLNCSTHPTAATNVTWKHNNSTAAPDWAITEPDNVTSQLMIPNVTLNDNGVYSCVSPVGVPIKVFNISIGLFPTEPSSPPRCYGCNTQNFICEWHEIPDTHLPTNITFEYRTFLFSDFGAWRICEHEENACSLRANYKTEFRLNITNELGQISVAVQDYNPFSDAVLPAPNIINIEPLAPHKLEIQWTFSGCGMSQWYIAEYQLMYYDSHTGNTTVTELPQSFSPVMSAELVMPNANTEYCFWMKARTLSLPFGEASNKTCNRTLPTVPDVDFDGPYFTETLSEEGEDLRDIVLTWQVRQTDMNEPFQGVTYFELELDKKGTTSNQTNSSVLIYDLNGANNYRLNQTSFSYVIKGLTKYDNYTIVVSAVNAAGRTRATVQVHPSVTNPVTLPSTGSAKAAFIPGLFVPLVALLIIALLAFGFQRLKNNSKPIPEPVFHGMNHHNVKPKHVEHEVFDELPLISKEKQRQLLESQSSESGEERGNRTLSSTSTETSSLEMGPVEKALLLEGSSSFERSPYCLLSEFTPVSPLQMAPDATEADLDSLPPSSGIYSCTGEGISVGGSSYYAQLGGARDAPPSNPYYSMCGEVPGKLVQMQNGSRCAADRSHLPDHQGYVPSTPVVSNGFYYSQLASFPGEARSHDDTSDYCDSYVINASAFEQPSSPPTPAQSEKVTNTKESPSHYVPSIIDLVPCNKSSVVSTPFNSGYVDNTDDSMGRLMGLRDDTSTVKSNPSSRDSSPEHAVIIHKLSPQNPISSRENIDEMYFPDPSFIPINTGGITSNIVGDTPISSQATSNPWAPQSDQNIEGLSSSTHPDTQSIQNSEQLLKKRVPPAAILPILSGNTNGYVPISQIPVSTQNSSISQDSPASLSQNIVQTGCPSDMGSKMSKQFSGLITEPSRSDDGYLPIAQISAFPNQNSCTPQARPTEAQQDVHTDSGSSDVDTNMLQSIPAVDQGTQSAIPVNGYVSIAQGPVA